MKDYNQLCLKLDISPAIVWKRKLGMQDLTNLLKFKKEKADEKEY